MRRFGGCRVREPAPQLCMMRGGVTPGPGSWTAGIVCTVHIMWLMGTGHTTPAGWPLALDALPGLLWLSAAAGRQHKRVGGGTKQDGAQLRHFQCTGGQPA